MAYDYEDKNKFVIKLDIADFNRSEYINFIKIILNFYCIQFTQDIDDIAKEIFFVDLDKYEKKEEKKNGKEKL